MKLIADKSYSILVICAIVICGIGVGWSSAVLVDMYRFKTALIGMDFFVFGVIGIFDIFAIAVSLVGFYFLRVWGKFVIITKEGVRNIFLWEKSFLQWNEMKEVGIGKIANDPRYQKRYLYFSTRELKEEERNAVSDAAVRSPKKITIVAYSPKVYSYLTSVYHGEIVRA